MESKKKNDTMNLFMNRIQMNLFKNRNRLMDIEKRFMVTKGEWEGVRG